MKAARKRRSTRRGTRGAILIESVIVITMLAVAMVVLAFFHRLYSAKLATMRVSRLDAWTQAMPGCGSGAKLDGDGISSVTDATDNGNLSTDDHSDVSGAKESNITDSRGRSYSVSTHLRVVCNEPVAAHEDLFSILEWAIKEIVGSNGFADLL